MNDLVVDLSDLDLDGIAVTAMHDAVGLPETGASPATGHSCACYSCGSCCCAEE